MSEDKHESSGFWTTLPGILSALAALITAVTGLIVGINVAGGDPKPEAPRRIQAPVDSRSRSQAVTADAIAGTWSGKVRQGKSDTFMLRLDIGKGCALRQRCGSISVSSGPCTGDLSLKRMSGDRYEFSVANFSASSAAACTPGPGEFLTDRSDGSLLYTTGYDDTIRGILHAPG